MKKISLRKGLMGLLLVGLIFTINIVKADDISNKVEITNIDANTGNAISGSKLVITDEEGNVIDEWISSTNAHCVYNLKVGKYTLKQTEVPAGYSQGDNSIIFEVEKDDKVISLTIDNTLASEEVITVPDTFSSTTLVYVISFILVLVGSLVAYNYANLKENE